MKTALFIPSVLTTKFNRSNSRCSLLGGRGYNEFLRYSEEFAADILFIVSLTAFIVVSVMKIGEDVLQYALISCVILSFRLHCLLNGINYRYSKKIKKEGKRDAKNS